MIKLIITDMDGTLLHDDKSMPAGTFDLIHALLRQEADDSTRH